MNSIKKINPEEYRGNTICFNYYHKSGNRKDPIFYPLIGDYNNFYPLFESGCNEFKINLNEAYLFTESEILNPWDLKIPVSILIELYGTDFTISHGGAAALKPKPHKIPIKVRDWFKTVKNLDNIIKKHLRELFNIFRSRNKEFDDFNEDIIKNMKSKIAENNQKLLEVLKENNTKKIENKNLDIFLLYLNLLCNVFIHDLDKV